jgi:hypothetical protein
MPYEGSLRLTYGLLTFVVDSTLIRISDLGSLITVTITCTLNNILFQYLNRITVCFLRSPKCPLSRHCYSEARRAGNERGAVLSALCSASTILQRPNERLFSSYDEETR